MSKQVLEFYLSDHFMLQSWERGIDKVVLLKLLRYVTPDDSGKKIVVITPSFYHSKNIIGKPNHCLILIFKQKLIITGFWCNHPNYLFKQEKEAEFQWIYT